MVRNGSNPTSVTTDSAGRLLRQQLLDHADNVITAGIGNIANGLILVSLFWNVVHPGFLLSGFGTLVFLVAWRLRIRNNIKTNANNLKMLAAAEGDVRLNAAFMGLTWGIAIGILLTVTEPVYQLFLGVLGTGMLSAGSISYRTLPAAGRFYIIGCAMAYAIGLSFLSGPAAIATLSLLVCFVAVLLSNAQTMFRNFSSRTMREFEVDESAETIRLLLNDYEEQGSDWLIKLDQQGNILEPSLRFAGAARRPIETLDGLNLFELIEDSADKLLLLDHFRQRRPVRRHIVSLKFDGSQRWWSISARPVHGDFCTYRGVVSDITAQRRAEARVSYMAHFDGLTGLPNRHQFTDHLYHQIDRQRAPSTLFYLDLDRFKLANDSLGHAAGDLVLKEVAQRIEAIIGPNDIAARLGGDEFVILSATDCLADAQCLGEKIVATLSFPFRIKDQDVVVGASVGVSFAPNFAKNGEELLRQADLALFAAKEQGRSCVAIFEPGMDEAAKQRLEMGKELGLALSDGQMQLYYQPIVNAKTLAVCGYEALIRWHHPQKGLIMPDQFIAIAEETGLIIQIGEWVIRQAVNDATLLDPKVTLSVNLSPTQMRSPNLIGVLVNALAHSGVDPDRICIEITETVLMRDTEANMATLHKLKQVGVMIALDDFGTGYSSLNYLRWFPFDRVKIDRSFISEVEDRADCRAIVGSIITLSRELNMEVVAEGIENEAQLDFLQAKGCDALQGFLFGKAVPVLALARYPKLISSLVPQLTHLRDQALILAENQLPLSTLRKKA